MPDPGYLLFELGYLTEEVAASALGVDDKTLAGYRTGGIGPEHAVVGRAIYYSKTALAKWLEAGGTRGREQAVALTPMRRVGGRR